VSLTSAERRVRPEAQPRGGRPKGRGGAASQPDSLILETEGVLTAWRRIQARARDLERGEVSA
jgi:hypothetical protein